VTDADLLAATPLFQRLPPDALGEILGAAATRSLARNDVLFDQGDAASDLFVVKSGRIAIATHARDGRESLVALMEAGDLFGEMSMFDGLGRSAAARALERSNVLAVPYAPVRAALDERPGLLWDLVALMAGRLRIADEALADTAFLDVAGRTAKRLLELAGDADEFSLPVTQEELAAMVGASRERVNKAIATFVRLRWLEQHERRYVITNRAELAQRAQ
jgi:CRP-like cAMP-binding protein